MITKVRGHFEEFETKIIVAENLAESAIEVTLKAASITTGSRERDEHLRSPDFLDVENYPTLSFAGGRKMARKDACL